MERTPEEWQKERKRERTPEEWQKELDCLRAEVDAYMAERDTLKKQNALLRQQYGIMDELHVKSVERVNRVLFAKLKVEHQLELLQSMIGTVLARFQVDTEEEKNEEL